MMYNYLEIFKQDQKVADFFEDYIGEDFGDEVSAFFLEQHNIIKQFFPYPAKNLPYSVLTLDELEEKTEFETEEVNDGILIYNDDAFIYIDDDGDIAIGYKKNNSLYLVRYQIVDDCNFDEIYTEEVYKDMSEAFDVNEPIINFAFFTMSDKFLPDESMEIKHGSDSEFYYLFDKDVFVKRLEVSEDDPISEGYKDMIAVINQNRGAINELPIRKPKSLNFIK